MSTNKYVSNDISKIELVDRLKNSVCNGDVMLEPRLQEYLKKRQFYKQNNIIPCVKLEQEFQITSVDRKILRDFIRGKRDIYDTGKLDKYTRSCENKRYFPSSLLKADPRVPQIEKCVKTQATPPNQGMFAPSEPGGRYYDNPGEQKGGRILDARDFVKFDVNSNRHNPRIDPKIDPGCEKGNKYQSQYHVPFPNAHCESDKYTRSNCTNVVSDYDSANRSNFKMLDEKDRRPDQDRYGKEELPYYNCGNTMDFKNKMVIPNPTPLNSRKDLNIGNYRFESYFGENLGNESDVKSAEVENELIRGMPTSRVKNRSYGYRNPEENYFQYLDEDFQNPDNSVEGWIRGGEATRIDNKAAAKNRTYTREVM